jgi:prephenate dehydratase
MKIFTLGPAGSYSHLTAIKLFPTTQNHQIEFCSTITEIFETVQNNKDTFGVVPLENSIEGTVRETYDQLLESNLFIWDTAISPIKHCLASLSKKFTTIASHEQALSQCRKNLHKQYKKIPTQRTKSTSEACQIASQNPDYAAITNPFAADLYNLPIIQPNFSDYPDNQTKFAIIHSKPNSQTHLKTLAALTPTNPDQPGLLIKMLFPFQENAVNLSKLESRPNKKKLDENIFFIEFEGDYRQARARKIFTYLEKDLQICKIKTFGGQVTLNNLLSL